MRLRTTMLVGALVIGGVYAEAPTGSPTKPDRKEAKALEEFKGKVQGKVVWSTSRVSGKHDIWIMNADGTDKQALTKSNNVDWFPRISPDGAKVLFVRSKMGWVAEADAEMNDKWDLFTINIDGTDEKKVAEDACWGSWRPNGEEIVFARGAKVVIKNLSSGEEKEIFDAGEKLKKGAYSQQPMLSPNGKLLAVTVRGSDRQTGIYNLESGEWNTTGAGCQITWWPDNSAVLRMNEGHGNGGTEILKISVDESGKPTDKIRGLGVPKEIRFMDLPGRRSHEYFPAVSQDGTWMVWCATDRGHEHDIYDYEVFVWNTNTDKKKDFVRLTFHDGNDRWPDIYVGAASADAASQEMEETEEETESMEEDAE